MSNYTVQEITLAGALGNNIWDLLHDGKKAALVLRDEAVLVEFIAGNLSEMEDDDPEYEESIFVVAKIGTQFFKKSGNYSSHAGAQWHGVMKEVTPTQKTVTVYE